MISLDIAGHRFQLRAAAVVVHDDHVLLHRHEDDDFWALPGGRVEPGEDAATTLVREMQEELGETVACGELLYLAENFYRHGGKPHHEIGMYFIARFQPHSPLLDTTRSHAGIEGDKRLEFRWFPRQALRDADLYPQFLRERLSEAGLHFAHVVQRG